MGNLFFGKFLFFKIFDAFFHNPSFYWPYLRWDWHEMKQNCIAWMLGQLCDLYLWPHPWPWCGISKVKFWNNCISGMGGLIDVEQGGMKSNGCLADCVTSNFDHTFDLDLGYWRSNFETAISHKWEGRLTWDNRDMSRSFMTMKLWPVWDGWMYKIVTMVTSDVEVLSTHLVNTLRPRKHSHHFACDIFISLNETHYILFKFHWSLFLKFQLTITQH